MSSALSAIGCELKMAAIGNLHKVKHGNNNQCEIYARRGSTSVKATYDMWVMPIATFVSLSDLRPHQQMVAEGKTSTPMHAEWTSFQHPDYTLDQIRTFKSLLLTMKRGGLGDIKAEVADAKLFGERLTIKAEIWPSIIKDAFIWMDYFSIPQPSAVPPGQDITQTMTDMKDAIDSIPSYIERCSHFFAVCPPIPHHELGIICDHGSWLGRGWCRFEQACLLLARFNDVPAIVVKGGGSPPTLASSNVACRPVGLGHFTCCARGHRIIDSMGNAVQIPCDKDALGSLLMQMLDKRIDHLLKKGDLQRFRAWKAATPSLMRGLTCESPCPVDEDFERFVHRYRFTQLDTVDLDQALLLAIVEGNIAAVKGAIRRGARVQEACWTADVQELGLPSTKGHNLPLGLAAYMFHERHGESILTILHQCGADVNFFRHSKLSKSRIPVLSAAVFGFQAEALRALHRLSDSSSQLEHATHGSHHMSSLSWATYAGDSACVKALLDTGGDANYINDHGSTTMMDAVRNPLGDKVMLQMLFDAGQSEHINTSCRAKTRVWKLFFFAARILYRLGRVKSRLLLGAACQQGSTALHFAAAEGECESARWLLEHGAHASLFIKNDLGMTPMDVSLRFGPFPAMENLLGGAELTKEISIGGSLRREHSLVRSETMKEIMTNNKNEVDTSTSNNYVVGENTFIGEKKKLSRKRAPSYVCSNTAPEYALTSNVVTNGHCGTMMRSEDFAAHSIIAVSSSECTDDLSFLIQSFLKEQCELRKNVIALQEELTAKRQQHHGETSEPKHHHLDDANARKRRLLQIMSNAREQQFDRTRCEELERVVEQLRAQQEQPAQQIRILIERAQQ